MVVGSGYELVLLLPGSFGKRRIVAALSWLYTSLAGSLHLPDRLHGFIWQRSPSV